MKRLWLRFECIINFFIVCLGIEELFLSFFGKISWNRSNNGHLFISIIRFPSVSLHFTYPPSPVFLPSNSNTLLFTPFFFRHLSPPLQCNFFCSFSQQNYQSILITHHFQCNWIFFIFSLHNFPLFFHFHSSNKKWLAVWKAPVYVHTYIGEKKEAGITTINKHWLWCATILLAMTHLSFSYYSTDIVVPFTDTFLSFYLMGFGRECLPLLPLIFAQHLAIEWELFFIFIECANDYESFPTNFQNHFAIHFV